MNIISLLIPFLLFARTALPLSEISKEGKITVNGITSDFDAETDQVLLSPELTGRYLETESDSKWGSQNELVALKLTWDSFYLYLAADAVLEGNNSVILFLDTGSGTGVEAVSSLDAKRRRIQFRGIRPDFFFLAENNRTDPEFYKINSSSSASYWISGGDPFCLSTLKNTVKGGFEARISWDRLYGLGIGRLPAGCRLKLSACVSGGDDSTAVDAAPDSSMTLPSEWDQTALLDNYLEILVDADSDQVPDRGAAIRERTTVAIDTTSLKYQPLAITAVIVKNPCFSPNGDGINDETEIRYYLTKNALADAAVYNLEGDLVCTVFKDRDLTAGYQSLLWNGMNERGARPAAGLYILNIRARSSGVTVVKRIGVYLLN